ncbi:MAG TPA: GNAT family N-acetyltransferase [Xanthobacteraceae bacterium]
MSCSSSDFHLDEASPAEEPRRQTHIDCLPDDEWHQAMCVFSDIHYEQTAIYGAGQRGEKSSHLLVTEDGMPLFGARIGLYTVPVLNRGLALVRFGPFWRHVGKPLDRKRYKAAIQALIDEYCVRRKLYLIVRPRAHPDIYPVEAELLQEMGIQPASTSMLDRYFVDLSLSEDEQRNSLGQRWRRNLKSALANNLEVRIGESPADVAAFQKIYAEMVSRKNLVYPGLNLVDLMPQMVAMPPEMRLHVALAYHEGQPVAGNAFSINGDVAYYVFGASSDIGVEKNAGYALQWNVMRWLGEHGDARWYELGGPGDPGIRQFKKGLAGKRGALLPIQEFHHCTDATARAVVKLLFGLRDLRNRVQRWQRGT